MTERVARPADDAGLRVRVGQLGVGAAGARASSSLPDLPMTRRVARPADDAGLRVRVGQLGVGTASARARLAVHARLQDPSRLPLRRLPHVTVPRYGDTPDEEQ